MTPAPAFAPDVVERLAPGGVLRASINVGNPILASLEPGASAPRGVSLDLAQALADRLGVALQLLVFGTAARSVDAVAQGQADVGFFAIDPLRGEAIGFTEAYLWIEGSYLVREASPLQDNKEVDRPGHRVVVGEGSAYDLHLSRTLQHATIVRAPSSPRVLEVFVEQGCEVAAGVRQQLEAERALWPGQHRLLPGRFMVIRQAMGLSRSRGEAARAALDGFVVAAKGTGFVAQVLQRHGITGASVAPMGAGADA